LKYEEQYVYKAVSFNSYRVTIVCRFFSISFLMVQQQQDCCQQK
jgi:hypothetical protein